MDRFVSAQDGLKLYYRDLGPRPSPRTPVVCLPGLTRNAKDFAVIAERMARDRRVLCLDMRGRGRSAYDPDWRNYAVPVEMNDVMHVMAAAGVPEAVVLGTSRGGLIAMAMAAVRPTALKGVILNDIGPEVAPEGLARILGYAGKMQTPETWDAAAAALRATNTGFDFTITEWGRLAKQIFAEENGRPKLDYDPKIGDATRAQMKAGPPPDLWPMFGALKEVPALVLRGVGSDLLSPAILQKMKAVKPDLTAVEIPGRGHAPLLDEPQSIAAIEAFLDRVG